MIRTSDILYSATGVPHFPAAELLNCGYYSIDKLCYIIMQHAIRETKEGMHKIKMMLNFIMKDLIQLRKNEYYNSNDYKIKNSKKVNYEGNKDAKRQYYV